MSTNPKYPEKKDNQNKNNTLNDSGVSSSIKSDIHSQIENRELNESLEKAIKSLDENKGIPHKQVLENLKSKFLKLKFDNE